MVAATTQPSLGGGHALGVISLGLSLSSGCTTRHESVESSKPTTAPAPKVERPANPNGGQVNLYPELRTYVEGVVQAGFDSIPEERRKRLRRLALFVETKRKASEPAERTYICTHNSRRSHMSQL